MISRLAFTDAWEMEHPADEVLRVLADVDSYMRWWPQVKEVERVDAEHGQLRVCSRIPISLRMTITREAELPEKRPQEVTEAILSRVRSVSS